MVKIKLRRKSVTNSVIVIFIFATSIVDIYYIQFSSNLINFLVHISIWAVFLYIIKYLVTQNSLLNKFERTVRISNLAMDQSPNIIVLTNQRGEVIFANEKLFSFTKLAQEEVISKTIGGIFPYPEASDIKDLYIRIKDGKEWQGYLKGYNSSHEPYWLRITGIPILKDNEDKTTLIIAVDVTKQRLTELALKESEEKYRELFNKANDAIFLHPLSINGGPQTFEDVNEVACTKLGYPREEMLRLTTYDISNVYENQNYQGKAMDFQLESHVTFERHLITKENHKIPFEMNAHKIKFKNRDYVLTVARDIKDRKLREQALIESEVKYRTLFENANDAIFLYEIMEDGTPGKYIEVNEVACKRYGYSRKEFLGISTLTLNSREFRPQIRKIIDSLPMEETIITESIHITKSGKEIPVEVSAHSFMLNGKKVILSNARDISNRKRNEQALKESEKKYFDLFHNSPAVKLIIDPTNAKIVDVNQAAQDFYGYSKDKLLKMNISEINSHSKERIQQDIQVAFESKAYQTFKFIHRLASGEQKDVEVYSGKVEMNNRILLNSTVIDVTNRSRAERALKISEEKYRNLFDNANDAIYLYEIKEDGTAGNLIEVNNITCNRLGYSKEELLSMTPLELCLEEQIEDSKEIIRKILITKHIHFERIHVTKDGRRIPVEINAHNFELNGKKVNLSIARDITKRKRTEKLALLGELSTGVAHEIKNPLAIIRGYTEYLQSDDDLNQETKESLQYIINTVDRLDKVVNSFLRFSQPVDFKLVPVDVVAVINEAINFIKPTANRQNVQIATDFMPSMPKWYLDPDLIMQVCLNLLLNSLEVMHHGTISITVLYDELNQMNKMVFKDDGPGIPKCNQSKIFEPFFTTKKAGSGLGLSIVANLVRNMYGTIEVESDEGCGTTFILSFPVIDSGDLHN